MAGSGRELMAGCELMACAIAVHAMKKSIFRNANLSRKDAARGFAFTQPS
jgi:hypothetical protein